jgi:predicted secreted protein
VGRLISMLGALTLAVSTSAWGGDAAFLNIIGFSANGRYFAFEQYGVQEGSAFAYSDVMITDLEKDELIKGTPIRVIAPDEQASQNVIRTQARGQAVEKLKILRIDQPAEIIASNPITERGNDRKTMAFNLYFDGLGGQLTPPQLTKDNDFELVLTSVTFPVAKDCYAEDGRANGFSLSVRKTATGTVTEKYKDTSVPTSRHCPSNYDIDTIASYRDDDGNSIFVAVIAVYQQGFEGPDRRFIAVPFNPL